MSSLPSIGFDKQIFLRQRVGGISRYFKTLIDALDAYSVDVRTPFSDPSNGWRHADLIHATYYGGRPYRLRPNQHLVSTLHDMAPERHPEHFFLPQFRSPHENKFKWLDSSELVVSVSASSADDLNFYMPEFSGEIRVIHHATSIGSVVPEPVDSLLPFRFLLVVGKRHAYKNGITLFRALSLFRQNLGFGNDASVIVFAGGGSFSKAEELLIRANSLEPYIVRLDADDARLAWLYRNAEAVLIPSLVEGFSLPLIEALVCDTPLIVSDIEVHREIGSGFAHFISPSNSRSWMEALADSFHNKLPKPSVRLGRERYAQLCTYYSAVRLGRAHMEAYLSV
jgi:glycosyltransferase involved in cell wall biosynthesis